MTFKYESPLHLNYSLPHDFNVLSHPLLWKMSSLKIFIIHEKYLVSPSLAGEHPDCVGGGVGGAVHGAAGRHPPPRHLAAFIKTECLSSSRVEAALRRAPRDCNDHTAGFSLCTGRVLPGAQAGQGAIPASAVRADLLLLPPGSAPRPGRHQVCTQPVYRGDQHQLTHCHYHTRYLHPHHHPASHTLLLPDPCTLQFTAVLQPH